MTGNLLLDSLISIGVIAVLVLVAWMLFRTPPPPIDQSIASERLAFDEPDFRAARWCIDRDGTAALAQSDAGEFALVARLGADLVTRRFRAGGAAAHADGQLLIVRPNDPIARNVRLRPRDADGPAARWARKIAGE